MTLDRHSEVAARLHNDGKPIRALRVLATAIEPLYEEQVWTRARTSAWDTASWHGALKRLVDLGLAERSGGRGGYRFAITDAGRERLS